MKAVAPWHSRTSPSQRLGIARLYILEVRAVVARGMYESPISSSLCILLPMQIHHCMYSAQAGQGL